MRTMGIGEKHADYGVLLHTFLFSMYGLGYVKDNECCLFNRTLLNHNIMLGMVGRQFFPETRLRRW